MLGEECARLPLRGTVGDVQELLAEVLAVEESLQRGRSMFQPLDHVRGDADVAALGPRHQLLASIAELNSGAVKEAAILLGVLNFAGLLAVLFRPAPWRARLASAGR